MHFLLPQRLLEFLHRLQEDDHLIGPPPRNIRGARLEVGAGVVIEVLPPRGQRIAGIRQRGVEVRFRREAGGVEPFVPIQVFEEGVGFAVVGEEGEQG